MLTIWGRRSSINVQKVMWAVGELDLPHTHINAGGKFGGLDTPEFGALNPNRRIPVLKHDNVVIWDSHAIIRYLARQFGEGTLWPTDPAACAHTDQWMEWVSTALQFTFMSLFWNLYRTPEPQRNPGLIRQGVTQSAALFTLLDRHLEGKSFITGDEFTMGDIPAGAQLYRYFTLDIERPKLPNIEMWYARLQERDAYRTNVMVPYDELRGRSTA